MDPIKRIFRMITRSFSMVIKLILIMLVILLASPIIHARADSSVCGPIGVDTTWTSAGNNYIVTCLVQVMPGVTLTIEPGTRVLFNNGTGMRIDGQLIARGVTFSSSSSTPSKGIWAHIYFTSTSVDGVFDVDGNYLSGSIIQDSLIVWGGGGTGVVGTVNIAGASPFLDNNNIFNSSTRGIYATGRSSSAVIHISHNAVNANNGGGIYVSSGLLEDNRIYDNSNGGVYAINSVLNSNDVYNNSGGNGAGIFASGCTLEANTVSGNSSNNNGGGIYAEGGTLTANLVTGNTASNDTSAHGGGIYATGGSLIGNTVSGNTATSSIYTGYGGGIFASLSTVSENIVSNNSAVNGSAAGGGIYGSGSTISSNVISGNTANASGGNTSIGGGVCADGGSVINNTITSNSVAAGGDSKGGGVYGSIATIIGNTFSGNTGNNGGAIYANKGMVTNNTVQDNTTSLDGTVYVYQGSALGNIIQGNSATNGGGLYGDGATLTGNTLEDNTAVLGAGIYALNSTVRGNTLTGNEAISDGGGIYASGGTVTSNTITGNSVPSYGHGSGAYIIGVTSFTYNNVLNNTGGGTAGGVSIDGQPVFEYNNLYGNLPYDAEVVSDLNVDGALNYWGETLCTQIPNKIYDGYDAPGRGYLTYAPSLYSPVPVAQLESPTDLDFTSDGSSVTLTWNPIAPLPIYGCRVPGSPAPDIGYLVYYGDDTCAPFDGTTLPQGASPIDVGNTTSITLTGLPGGATFFAVTAYDYLTRQSAFSNVVGTEAVLYSTFLPLMTK